MKRDSNYICPKCGGEEYYTYRDFPGQKGIKKCRACGCEMVDPHRYFMSQESQRHIGI